MTEEWIAAADALTLLQPAFSQHAGRMRICERAHAGMIRARAKHFEIGRRVSRDADVPAEFWWAEGHEALEQDWIAGDFSTWIDRKVEMKAFGVHFVRADIEDLVPQGPGPEPSVTSLSVDDIEIIERLEKLLPMAALSYKQSALDMLDESRISFRGTAAELRETLREVLDHLAPDQEVESQHGYSREEDRDKPTMKQKVRFILKLRGLKSSSDTPEQVVVAFDEAFSSFTRAVYNRSSGAVHTASDRERVAQLRRYAVAVFHEILKK